MKAHIAATHSLLIAIGLDCWNCLIWVCKKLTERSKHLESNPLFLATSSLLEWLWKVAAGLVLETLGFQQPPSDGKCHDPRHIRYSTGESHTLTGDWQSGTLQQMASRMVDPRWSTQLFMRRDAIPKDPLRQCSTESCRLTVHPSRH